jgi:hypothetical protein
MTSLPLTLRPPLPRSLYIETTSRCNCWQTASDLWREPQKDLGWGQFRTIVTVPVSSAPSMDRRAAVESGAAAHDQPPRAARPVVQLERDHARQRWVGPSSTPTRRVGVHWTSSWHTYARIRGWTPSTRWRT